MCDIEGHSPLEQNDRKESRWQKKKVEDPNLHP